MDRVSFPSYNVIFPVHISIIWTGSQQHALSGRCVPEYDMEQIREVIEDPYRIIYYIKPDQIDIIAVLHCSRNVLNDS